MMLMYNVITARECALAGIPRTTLVAAQSCCLTRLSRGIFTVTRRCDHHEDFHVAIEDPSVLELRSSLTQRKSVAGSERLRRLEHLSVLDSYRFYRPDDVIGGRPLRSSTESRSRTGFLPGGRSAPEQTRPAENSTPV